MLTHAVSVGHELPLLCECDRRRRAPLGRRLAHVPCAAWKAGAAGLMPDGRLTLPFGLRSGKLGTPCARMQSEYLTPAGETPIPDLAGGLLEDPHADRARLRLAATRKVPARRWVSARRMRIARV